MTHNVAKAPEMFFGGEKKSLSPFFFDHQSMEKEMKRKKMRNEELNEAYKKIHEREQDNPSLLTNGSIFI